MKADGSKPTPPGLAQVLRSLHEAQESGDQVGLKRQQSRLFDLVHGRVTGVVRGVLSRRGAGAFEDDATSAALTRIIDRWWQCKALEQREPAVMERKAWAWIRMIAINCARNELRALRRREAAHRRLLDQERRREKLAREQVAPPAWACPEGVTHLRVAADHACELVRTGQPEDLRREAKDRTVYSKVERVELSVRCWFQHHVNGVAQYDIGCALGFEGSKERVQNRVAQYVKRGRWALALGARRAALAAHGLDRDKYETLALQLAQPRRAAGTGEARCHRGGHDGD